MPTPQLDQAIRDRIDAFAAEISELVHQAAMDTIFAALGVGGGAAAVGPVRRSKKKRGRKAKARKAASAPAQSTGRKAKGRKKAAKKAGKRGRRSGAALDRTAAKVVAYLEANPGQSITDIAAGLGVKSAALKKPIAILLENGTLTKTGERRGTRYSAL